MKRVAASAVVLSVLALASVARAAEGGSDAAPRVAPPTFAVGFNPFALFGGRASFDALYFPSPHLAIVASGHYLHTVEHYDASRLASSGEIFHALDTHDRGGGGELGLRYYFPWDRGRLAATAGFIGVSVLYGRYTYSGQAPSVDYATIGVALDGGVTFAVGGLFVVTLGLGIQGTSNSPRVDMDVHRPTDGIQLDWPSSQTLWNGGGVRPRLLMTVGFGN